MDYNIESYLENSGKDSAFKLPLKKIIQITALIVSKAIPYFQISSTFSIFCLYKHIYNER